MSLTNEIARSHLETLIERVADIEKAVPDSDGDYLIKTENAGFFARVDGTEIPVIRVFAVVADQIEKSPGLLETLNEINTSLSFVRAMWIGSQVLFEGEMLALTADIQDFSQVCRTVAMASDRFGPDLISAHGGRPLFEASKTPGYAAGDVLLPGYL